MIKLLTPTHWKSYELLDSGGFEKLEKFGSVILSRPEPQAIWDKSRSEKEWESAAHATFKRDEINPEKGIWKISKKLPDLWHLPYTYNSLDLKFKLALSSFKHIGIFPEQASNWNYIYDAIRNLKTDKHKFLNLFAYTGGASIAAATAGAEVTHVDSIKQVITWARENMELNKLKDIRWVVEDVMKFVTREVKRGNKYHGIILDPPAYGRGPAGEKWILEEHIKPLLKLCAQLVHPTEHFLILNVYSLGFSTLIIDNLIKNCFPPSKNTESGELYIEDQHHKKLPLGVFYRFNNGIK